MAEGINDALEPFRERRRVYEEKPEMVREILVEGTRRASRLAAETLEEVRERMGIPTSL